MHAFVSRDQVSGHSRVVYVGVWQVQYDLTAEYPEANDEFVKKEDYFRRVTPLSFEFEFEYQIRDGRCGVDLCLWLVVGR